MLRKFILLGTYVSNKSEIKFPNDFFRSYARKPSSKSTTFVPSQNHDFALQKMKYIANTFYSKVKDFMLQSLWMNS